MIDLYLIIQFQSLKQTEALVVAHQELQEMTETEMAPATMRSPKDTTLVPTSPTVPLKRTA